jgi:hypothetical protein
MELTGLLSLALATVTLSMPLSISDDYNESSRQAAQYSEVLGPVCDLSSTADVASVGRPKIVTMISDLAPENLHKSAEMEPVLRRTVASASKLSSLPLKLSHNSLLFFSSVS